MKILVFNLLTVPDTESGREIYALGTGQNALDDKSTAKAMLHLHQQKTGSADLPNYLQRIVAISILSADLSNKAFAENRIVSFHGSVGHSSDSEADLLEAFSQEVRDKNQMLISWQGTRFDGPVLQYRCLKHARVSPLNTKRDDSKTCIDLSQELSGDDRLNAISLNDIAVLSGLAPLKIISPSRIWKRYLKGDVETLRRYNEQQTQTIYSIYLRYLLINGKIDTTLFQNALSR